MTKVTVSGIIKTSIVTAFTIATALIWKEVITDTIHVFFPGEELLYKFITAIIATIIIIIVIYTILSAEKESEVIFKKIRDKKNKYLYEKKKIEKLKKENKKLKKKIRKNG